MPKKKEPTLKIIKITDYKGFKIMIQQIVPANLFQVVLFKEGQFYQAHDIITPEKGQKGHSEQDLIKIGVLYLDTAMAIADKIDEANNEDLKKAKKPEINLTRGIKAD